MPTSTFILTVTGIWVALIALVQWVIKPLLARGPGRNAVTGLLWRIVRLYCRLMHRVRFTGVERLPKDDDHGGLIVVSNHTGSVDPLLIQAGCPFEIRWMMASEMMAPSLDWLWRRYRIIGVERSGRDSRPLREAIRHVNQGGAIGIFPEGRIVTPPRQVWPFNNGVGLMVAKTKARVLLVWVSDTPDTNEMVKSIITPSHARVEFVDLIDFGDERDGQKIVQVLRERIAAASGWPINDDPVPTEAALQNG